MRYKKSEGLKPGRKGREPLRVFPRKARVKSATVEREINLSKESTLAPAARSVDVLRFREPLIRLENVTPPSVRAGTGAPPGIWTLLSGLWSSRDGLRTSFPRLAPFSPFRLSVTGSFWTRSAPKRSKPLAVVRPGAFGKGLRTDKEKVREAGNWMLRVEDGVAFWGLTMRVLRASARSFQVGEAVVKRLRPLLAVGNRGSGKGLTLLNNFSKLNDKKSLIARW